jgi:hypothetical protein
MCVLNVGSTIGMHMMRRPPAAEPSRATRVVSLCQHTAAIHNSCLTSSRAHRSLQISFLAWHHCSHYPTTNITDHHPKAAATVILLTAKTLARTFTTNPVHHHTAQLGDFGMIASSAIAAYCAPNIAFSFIVVFMAIGAV